MDAQAVVTQLATNASFREAFSESPREALKTANIKISDEELHRLEAVPWAKAGQARSRFEDNQVLRCSAAY